MEDMKIFRQINAIMADINAIGKDRQNQQQGFMFRGIDQVMNTLHPILVKHGVVIVPEVVDTKREERQTLKGGNLIYTMHKVVYHFIADDGSEVNAVMVGEGMDMADKSSNKALAIAFKYACFQVFCIPTEEMAQEDPDAYVPEESFGKDAEERFRGYLSNCTNKQDLVLFCEAYSELLKKWPRLMEIYQERKREIIKP